MSRYTIPARDQSNDVEVGWNPDLGTYFGRVLGDDRFIEADEDPIVFWIGHRRGEIQTTGQLAALMAPYAEIPIETIAQLRIDRVDYRCGPVPQRVEPEE